MAVERPGAARMRSTQTLTQPSSLGVGTVRQVLLSAAALLLAVGMIYYYSGVLIPLRQRQFELPGVTLGNWSDLYPRWLGACELLRHGRNPYSPEVTQEIQRGFYGRPIDRSKLDDPKDPQAFAYPLYVAFLFVPLLHFSFESVRNVFTGVLVLLTAASILLWMRALRVRLRLRAVLLALVAAMSSYAVVDGLHLQQLTLLVAALIAASMAALATERLYLAGVLLALATVKPQLAVLVLAFLLLWTVGAWRSRKWFAVGFGSAMAALLIGSEVVLPGWFLFWRQQTRAYIGYVKPSLLVGLLGQQTAMVVAAVAILICVVLFWRVRKEPPGSAPFNFALVVALLLTVLFLPNAGGAKYNQVLLIPAVVWLLTSGRVLARKTGLARIAWLIAVNVLTWEWVLALPVSFAGLVLRHGFQREMTLFVAGPELLVYFFPLALALFVLSAPTSQLWPPLRNA
jgi:Glycosyltransferase family 87